MQHLSYVPDQHALFSRGKREVRNLWLLRDGELLYYVGTVAVLFSRVGDSQRHYTEHTMDITAMDVHPDKETVVSGQRGEMALDFIFNMM